MRKTSGAEMCHSNGLGSDLNTLLNTILLPLAYNVWILQKKCRMGVAVTLIKTGQGFTS